MTVAAALPQAATAIAMHESGAAAKLPIAAQQAVADAMRTAAMPVRDAAATDAASTVLASAAGDSAAPRRATTDAVQPATSEAAASRPTSTRPDVVSRSPLPSAIDADKAGHASPVSMPSADRAVDAPIAVAVSWLRTALPWLLGVWGFAVALAWLRLAGSARALQRLLRESAPLDCADWQQDGAALAAHFALPRQPQLRRHAALASPLATAGNTIVVPDWALDLPASQRRALLAHEVAHLARRDPLWRGVLAFWRGLLCPLPLAALAAQRLDLLAEWRCDAAAAQATGDGRALAACLAHCLERRLHPDYPAFAAAMAAARSPLLQRAEHLLEGVSMSSVSLPWRVRLAPIAAVVAAVLAVPAFVVPVSHAAERVPVPAPPVPPAQPAVPAVPAAPARPAAGGCKVVIGHCTSVRSHNGDLDVDIGGTGRQLTYRSRGDVRFNDQDDGIASLGAGAKVEWEETVGTETRRVEYRGDGATLTTRYWKDGKEQPLDAEGTAWIARIVPQLLREAAIDVEGRVARLVARGGNGAVLAEIGLIRSDHAQGRYLGELLRTRKLADSELDRALELIAALDSDHEQRLALTAALASQQLGKPQWRNVLAAVAEIDSDHERATLLVETAAQVTGDDELRGAWLAATEEIGSDYERRRSLEALLAVARDDAALLAAMEAGGGIGSDYELRELLSHTAQKARDPNAIARRYAQTAKRIGSDFERREALVALVRAGALAREGALAVLDAASGIGSDFERREVLVEVARRVPDDAVRARVLQLADDLSDFERRQVEEAVGAVRG
ncbi:M56 family metallopeptidase [Tahibacter caeni]|uniref:M56 family metallopeptidase n=1 Tax=Tahibacter caeni TaxID=1453545 RepID=UPI0021485521